MTNVLELKAEVARKGLNLLGLAAALKMNPTTLNRKMKGESEFTQSEIQGIMDKLDLSIDKMVLIFFSSDNA